MSREGGRAGGGAAAHGRGGHGWSTGVGFTYSVTNIPRQIEIYSYRERVGAQ